MALLFLGVRHLVNSYISLVFGYHYVELAYLTSFFDSRNISIDGNAFDFIMIDDL